MKWKAPRAATTTDTGSQPTRVSRRGGHLVIDGLSAQIHNGLPTSILPTRPLSRSNDPKIATGQKTQTAFHTRSLHGLVVVGSWRRGRLSWWSFRRWSGGDRVAVAVVGLWGGGEVGGRLGVFGVMNRCGGAER